MIPEQERLIINRIIKIKKYLISNITRIMSLIMKELPSNPLAYDINLKKAKNIVNDCMDFNRSKLL